MSLLDRISSRVAKGINRAKQFGEVAKAKGFAAAVKQAARRSGRGMSKAKLREGRLKAQGKTYEQGKKIRERTEMQAKRMGKQTSKESKSAMLKKRRILENFKSKMSMRPRGK